MSDVVFKQQQPIRCPSCDKVFIFKVEFTEAQMEKELWVKIPCDGCKTELIIDFEQYLTAETTIYKSATPSKGSGLVLDLPDEILAKKH